MKLSEVARLTGGELTGEDIEVTGVAGLLEAGPREASFLDNPKYKELAKNTKAGVVILKEKLPEIKSAQIVCSNPYLAFAKLMQHFQPPPSLKSSAGIHNTAVIDKDAELGEKVSIGANVYLGPGCKIGNNVVIKPNTVIEAQVIIGDDCLIYPNVTIREGVIVGKRVIIHSGAVIGSDGFGYAKQSNGSYYKIPQIGTVVLEDDVEIGANATIDRATMGKTLIKRGVKIDNLVMVAHNVEVGENTLLISQVGIAGSTKIGRQCIIAGQAGVVGHINIGDKVIVEAKSVVTKDIADNQQILGFPAEPVREARERMASIRMLPEALKRIKRLEKRIKKLEEELSHKEEEEID